MSAGIRFAPFAEEHTSQVHEFAPVPDGYSYLEALVVEFACKMGLSTSYACRGPSHTTASCGWRARQIWYARTSRPAARPQPLRRMESADTMSSRFICPIPNLLRPRADGLSISVNITLLDSGRERGRHGVSVESERHGYADRL
jgi:hypothetical protein